MQELYEKKLVTYPRTDARVLSSAVAKEIAKNIGGLKNVPELSGFAAEILEKKSYAGIGRSMYTDDKKITDHYAIIPTGQGISALNSLKTLQKQVYDLICRRFPDAKILLKKKGRVLPFGSIKGIVSIENSIYEVLVGNADMGRCIEHTQWDRLDVAGADIRLAGAELELVDEEDREYQLKKALEPYKDRYDFIVIDCPPSLGLLTLNALAAADSVLIPIQCEYYALEGVTSLMNTISRVRRSINTNLIVEGILLTMLDGRTNLGLQVVDQVKKHFKKQVYPVTIPRSVRLGEAPSHGEPIHIYDPRSAGAVAYRALGEEVLKRNGKKVKKH